MKPWEPDDLLCWDIDGILSVSGVVVQAGRHDRLSLVHLFDLNGKPVVLVWVGHADRIHYDFVVAPDLTAVLPRSALLSKQELRRDGLLTKWHDAATTP